MRLLSISVRRWVVTLAVMLAATGLLYGKSITDSVAIEKLFLYRSTIEGTLEGHATNAYLNYQVKTERRNATLFGVPVLYTFANATRRHIVGEYFLHFTYHDDKPNEAEIIMRTSTIRRHRTMMPDLFFYLTPTIYKPTLVSDRILSPFNRRNRRYYDYSIDTVTGSYARVAFQPKTQNTQAVTGHAMVDTLSGRVASCTMVGEYDMVSFEMSFIMGDSGLSSLTPKKCSIKAKFSFLGNKLRAIYHTTYGVPDIPKDSLPERGHEREAFEKWRPDSLTEEQRALYAAYDSVVNRPKTDTVTVKEKNFARDILWDAIGDKLLHRIRGNFGTDDRGFYRLSPLLNPLYLGYSHRRGLTYRFVTRGGYDFSDNSDIYTRFKIGYSFKLRQLLFDIPITYNFDKKHDGYLKVWWVSGERVKNSTVLDQLREDYGDTLNIEKIDIDDFKHSRAEVSVHYDFNDYVGFATGFKFQRWSSVRDEEFQKWEKPIVYYSTSWDGEISVRPIGWKGPVLTLNYERTFNDYSTTGMNFEKWEFDCSYLHELPALRAVSLRAGFGMYTSRMRDTYFLDFNNFRNTFIPGGWNDEWSGDFELLHRNWYNSSKYYIRMNANYESPLLLLSWIPLVGTVIEKERLYLSTLHLHGLSHYMELGYGFTNRLFSTGIFLGLKRGEYYNIGVRFGFELFNGW